MKLGGVGQLINDVVRKDVQYLLVVFVDELDPEQIYSAVSSLKPKCKGVLEAEAKAS